MAPGVPLCTDSCHHQAATLHKKPVRFPSRASALITLAAQGQAPVPCKTEWPGYTGEHLPTPASQTPHQPPLCPPAPPPCRFQITAEDAERRLKALVFEAWRGGSCDEAWEDTLKMTAAIDIFLPFLPLQKPQVRHRRAGSDGLPVGVGCDLEPGLHTETSWTRC